MSFPYGNFVQNVSFGTMEAITLKQNGIFQENQSFENLKAGLGSFARGLDSFVV